ncbi:MAG TPA: RNA polymerase sigma factor [Steroidobacteraceae bacterium]|nr:RNA polymerase sigma factor [Steroidobacteraceae bacterium]
MASQEKGDSLLSRPDYVIIPPAGATHLLTNSQPLEAQQQMACDPDALPLFAQIEEHRRILLKVARSYCREPADREDLIQDILVALWRAYPAFQGRSQFSTWMYQIALNVAISDALRVHHGSKSLR